MTPPWDLFFARPRDPKVATFLDHALKCGDSLLGVTSVKQIENFSEVYERLGTHLRNAQQSYADADHRLDRARNVLDELVRGAPEPKALEAAATAPRD